MVDRLLSIPEVAERLNCSERLVRKLVFERRLPRTKIGRLVRVAESDVETFVRRGRIESEPPSAR
jgi:excisionase family DNA binding protein